MPREKQTKMTKMTKKTNEPVIKLIFQSFEGKCDSGSINTKTSNKIERLSPTNSTHFRNAIMDTGKSLRQARRKTSNGWCTFPPIELDLCNYPPKVVGVQAENLKFSVIMHLCSPVHQRNAVGLI